jgi:hypothetical protein
MRFELVAQETPDHGILGWADTSAPGFACLICNQTYTEEGGDEFENGGMNLLSHMEDAHDRRSSVTWCIGYPHDYKGRSANAPMVLVNYDYEDDNESKFFRCTGHLEDEHATVIVPDPDF